MSRKPHDFRPDLARVRGLGSAKEGVQHWWVQRLTALALVPLTPAGVPIIAAATAALVGLVRR